MKTKLEIIKIKGEIDKSESKRTIELINKTRSWYFEKNKIDKVLVNLIKKGKKKTRLIVSKMKRETLPLMKRKSRQSLKTTPNCMEINMQTR